TQHCPWFAIPYAAAIRPRANVDRVFQYTWHRSVVFRRDEQHRICSSDLLAKRNPRLRRGGVEGLVVQGQVTDLAEVEFHLRRRQGCQGMSRPTVETLLAQTAYQHGYFLSHRDSLSQRPVKACGARRCRSWPGPYAVRPVRQMSWHRPEV